MESTWMQVQWNKVLEFHGHDAFNVRVYGTFVVSMIIYWGMGGLFTIVDYTGTPKFMMKYRVQENVKTYPISKEQLHDLVKVILQNQLLVFVFAIVNFYLDEYRGRKMAIELPSLLTVVCHLIFFQMVREVTFYYSHRLLHHPSLYKWIHKKHHTWTSPVAIAAAYCHPVEHIFSNVIPIALGPSILNSHTILLWIYTVYATIETLTVHSGFHLPLLKSPEFHDFHHLKFNCNYGVTGLMDRFHGTDSLFRKSKQFIRDKRTFTTTPIKVLIP
ncbi:hypothetical protein HA402_004664 [Bradysia odoriphaga]|nr:hypothetical protein HA402_004664 [Bradysia odoriphaga]